MFTSSARPPGFPAAPSTGARVRVVAANGSKITEFDVDILTGCPSVSLAPPSSLRLERPRWHTIAHGMRRRARAVAGSMTTGCVALGEPSARQFSTAQARRAMQPRTGAHAGRDDGRLHPTSGRLPFIAVETPPSSQTSSASARRRSHRRPCQSMLSELVDQLILLVPLVQSSSCVFVFVCASSSSSGAV